MQGSSPPYLRDLFNRFAPSVRPSRHLAPNVFPIPNFRSSKFRNSFYLSAIYFWHSLPDTVRCSPTVGILKGSGTCLNSRLNRIDAFCASYGRPVLLASSSAFASLFSLYFYLELFFPRIVFFIAYSILSLFYFLITYGVCKNRKYCNRMSEKKNSLLLTNVHDLYVLEDETSQTKFPSVCLSVCLYVWMYVRTWTFHVGTITFEEVSGSEQNLVVVFYVRNVGLLLKSKVIS